MQYLARKIRRALWDETLQVDPEDVAADAVTNDLRTSSQTLSVWECGTKDELTEIALVLACGMKGSGPVGLVLLDADVLKSAGIPMVRTPADTPLASLNDRHVDLAELTLARLVAIARRIAEKVRSDTDCWEFRKQEVRDIVAKAVQEDRLSVQQLKKEWQDQIRDSGLA